MTESERCLHRLTRRSFLSLWCNPAVYCDQGRIGRAGHGKELCDLLVVFGDDVLIFSDKECGYPRVRDARGAWSRWYRKAIEESAGQLYGAERWLRKYPNRVFVDRGCTRPLLAGLPTRGAARYHRIVVARGVAGPAGTPWEAAKA